MNDEFNLWYKRLEVYFENRDVDWNEGPYDWCSKEEWKVHFDNQLTPNQAYIEEC